MLISVLGTRGRCQIQQRSKADHSSGSLTSRQVHDHGSVRHCWQPPKNTAQLPALGRQKDVLPRVGLFQPLFVQAFDDQTDGHHKQRAPQNNRRCLAVTVAEMYLRWWSSRSLSQDGQDSHA